VLRKKSWSRLLRFQSAGRRLLGVFSTPVIVRFFMVLVGGGAEETGAEA